MPMKFPDESTEFYYELGVTFTQWASVELALFRVFRYCLGDVDHGQAAITFFSIENFRSKLKVIDELAKHVLTPPHFGDWQKLRKRVEKASTFRNHLAHYMVLADATDTEERGIVYQLRPMIFNPANAGKACYYVKDLAEIATPPTAAVAAAPAASPIRGAAAGMLKKLLAHTRCKNTSRRDGAVSRAKNDSSDHRANGRQRSSQPTAHIKAA